MKNAILATIYHAVSTVEKPQHEKCPKGPSSWCFYRSALAQGMKPGLHRQCVGAPLKPEYFKELLPIYKRLTDDSLLQRRAECHT